MSRRLRLTAAILAFLTVTVGLMSTAGAQDQGGGDTSYLPDAQVKGIPASKYRVVVQGGDCKLEAEGSNPLVAGVTGGLSASIPGASGIVNNLTPNVNAPDALCPSAIGKDGMGGATSGAWAAGVYVVSVLTDGIESLLSFDIGGLLAPMVGQISAAMNAKVADRLQLRYFALAFGAIIVGFMFLTGRLGRAFGELLLVAVGVGLTGLILANVAGFYRSFSDFGREASSAGLSVAGDDNAAGPLDSVREALIWDQWQSQQFGHDLPQPCADAAFAALRDDKSVIKAVDGAGCHDEAKRASKSSWGRVFGAVAYLVLALVVALMLIKFALGMVLGQAGLALGFIFAPLALPLAMIKWGRVVAAAWLAAMVRLLAAMVFNGLMLAITALILQGVLHAAGLSAFMRLAASAGTAIMMNRLSSQWMRHIEGAAGRSTTRAVLGGVAVGAGIGAGSVAAQGIVSSAHQRTDQAASRARTRTVRTATRAGGTVTETGAKLVGATPVAKGVQERREARHKVEVGEHRQRVAAQVDGKRQRGQQRYDRASTRQQPHQPRPEDSETV